MDMITKKYFLMALGLCMFCMPASAQQRDITEAEINQFYEDLLLKESSIINTDSFELQDRQREEIAKEIAAHYTDGSKMKLREVRMTEKYHRLPVIDAYYDKFAYENMLEVEKKIKNLQGTFDIKNIDFMGQNAIVDVNIIYTYQVDATDHDDIIKFTGDVISKATCKSHMTVDYDDRPRIYNENCHTKTFVSNMYYEVPEYIEDAQGMVEIRLDQDVVFKR